MGKTGAARLFVDRLSPYPSELWGSFSSPSRSRPARAAWLPSGTEDRPSDFNRIRYFFLTLFGICASMPAGHANLYFTDGMPLPIKAG